jgi:nucleotide-binding universal stress UspA family protein
VFKNILVPTDGSDLAAKAVEQGILFAKEIGAGITAVMVTEPFHALAHPERTRIHPDRIQEACGGSGRESAR